jgi:uncharacterized protein (TIGR00730 family)
MKSRIAKAYKNAEFLNSIDARTIRILAEYLYPNATFRDHHIKDTIVFFGSARIKSPEEAADVYRAAETEHQKNAGPQTEKELKRAEIIRRMSRYYVEARDLAARLTEWSQGLKNSQYRFIVCSGGGPGIMEAANRGALDVPGSKSIGLNISIPQEQGSNAYITNGLNFEFHYFFMRKFWFVYLAKALVVFPGGFGTMDELWEVLTLIQTGKLQKKMPVVLYGSEYWHKAVNFQYLVDNLFMDEKDLQLFKIADSPDEAFQYLKESLTKAFL